MFKGLSMKIGVSAQWREGLKNSNTQYISIFFDYELLISHSFNENSKKSGNKESG